MNWLTKINFNIAINQLGAFRSAILFLLVITVAFFCGYRLGNFYHSYQVDLLQQQQNRLEILYKNIASQTKKINTLEVELEIEKLSNSKNQQSLTTLEQENFHVKKRLAFYEKVMAPEKQADGLVIDDINIEKTGSSNHYRFQVVLVQKLIRKRYAKGHIDIAITGSLQGSPKTYALEKISTMTQEDKEFSFQYFQIVHGELTLPENFIAEKINVQVVLPKGKWQKYNRIEENFDWQTILKTSH